jgi:hypothetical protein
MKLQLLWFCFLRSRTIADFLQEDFDYTLKGSMHSKQGQVQPIKDQKSLQVFNLGKIFFWNLPGDIQVVLV